MFEGVYTIEFVPDFAGQPLTVQWIDNGDGTVLALHGATLAVVPEPATFGLALLGLCALVGRRGERVRLVRRVRPVCPREAGAPRSRAPPRKAAL